MEAGTASCTFPAPARSTAVAASSAVPGTSGLPAQSGHDTGAGEGDEFDVDGDPRLEAHGRTGGDVEPLATRGGAVELKAGVGLGEVVVGADLDGPVGGVQDGEAGDGSPLVEGDGPLRVQDLSGDHRLRSPVRRSAHGR